EILVHGFGRTLLFAPRDPPATVEAARSHLGFCLATALIRRDRLAFFTDAFDPSSLADPTILRLARRVQALLDPQYDAEYPAQSAKARVEIRLTSGEVLTAEADRAAIGRYHHPTRSDIAEKFAATTGQSLDPLSAENFLEDVWHLEQTDDIGPMMNRLSTALRRPQ
ncbi:MAG: hypothetical protein ACREOS_07725, partial [Candidatus Dormibacteraceae bacterium]